MKKKRKRMKKKIMLKKYSRNGFGLLPNCIVKKKNLYCKMECSRLKKKLYCNTPLCIVNKMLLEWLNCIAIHLSVLQ